MKMVIVADLDLAEDVDTCILGYSSKDGWEELDIKPIPLPHKLQADWYTDGYKEGFNACLEEIAENANCSKETEK